MLECYEELLHTTHRVGAAKDSGGWNIVAFSGGVDSSLVAALVREVYPENSLAVIGVSPALPKDQLELARQIAQHISIPLQEINTTEGELDGYVMNQGNACYYCKSTLYDALRVVGDRVSRLGKASVLFNGTNSDDLEDATRVGLIAAEEYHVASPLRGVSKSRVRLVAKHLQLPNHSVAASPCLRSRLALTVPATSDHLRAVEAAEVAVRSLVHIPPDANLRVRILPRGRSAVEVDVQHISSVEAVLPALAREIKNLGFSEPVVRPFKSGSVATGPHSRGSPELNHVQQ